MDRLSRRSCGFREQPVNRLGPFQQTVILVSVTDELNADRQTGGSGKHSRNPRPPQSSNVKSSDGTSALLCSIRFRILSTMVKLAIIARIMGNDYLERILTAQVYDVAVETPLELAPNLSQRIDNRLLLKREDMQPVFSFKLRGAYNKMVQLSPAGARAWRDHGLGGQPCARCGAGRAHARLRCRPSSCRSRRRTSRSTR